MKRGDKVVTPKGTGFVLDVSDEYYGLVRVEVDRPEAQLCKRVEFFDVNEVRVVS